MTYHSIMRTKERAKLNEDAAKRMIVRAKEYGIPADEFHSEERRYLERMEEGEKKVIYYSGYVFVLTSDSICITMFPVPQWFGKRNRFSGKTAIRNVKKYTKMRGNDYEYKRAIQHYNL